MADMTVGVALRFFRQNIIIVTLYYRNTLSNEQISFSTKSKTISVETSESKKK